MLRLTEKIEPCHQFLIRVTLLEFQLQTALKSVHSSIPRKPNQVRIAKDRMFVVDQPVFSFRVTRVPTPQIALEFYLTHIVPFFSRNSHLLKIPSLVTLAQILAALTTL